MSTFVFLGPSLPVDRAKATLDATYLPPLAAGDLHALVEREQPRVVGIVDGVFHRIPAVRHKEILFALSRGVRVYGASSMGALRAAELHTFGMRGVGRIFEDFRDGVLEDDDEVALAHGDASLGHRGLSEPMVNLRHGLFRACAAGVLTEAERDRLVASAKGHFYTDRSWARLYKDAAGLGLSADRIGALRAWVDAERPNLKRDDALLLLERIAADARSGAAPEEPGFVFHHTSFFEELASSTRRAAPAGGDGGDQEADVSMAALCRHVRVSTGGRGEILRSALFDVLLAVEAEKSDVSVSETAMAEAQRRVALAFPDLDPETRDELATLEALTDELVARRSVEVDGYVRLELARKGQLTRETAELARRDSHLKRRGLSNPRIRDVGITEQALLEWYATKVGVDEQTAEGYAERIGIARSRAFLTELARHYLWERASNGRGG